MRRIEQCFAKLKQQQRKALIPYITAGDPSLAVTLDAMHALVEAGADILELGVPFSDPMADGPVIALAHERALKGGASLAGVLSLVEQFRASNTETPVVLMGYLNPVEAMGYDTFFARCQQVGVDGLLLVDLPPEEAEHVQPLAQQYGLDLIFLIAPTTTEARIELIAKAATGYLYYVSVKGVTGSAALNVAEVAQRLETIRNHAKLPIGVGFGIKDAESARRVGQVADGVVVGSALVQHLADHSAAPDTAVAKVKALMADMRHALDN